MDLNKKFRKIKVRNARDEFFEFVYTYDENDESVHSFKFCSCSGLDTTYEITEDEVVVGFYGNSYTSHKQGRIKSLGLLLLNLNTERRNKEE